MLNRIWAPWRAHYIQSASAAPQPVGECFLCRGLASDQDRQNLVVERGTNSFVVLNRYPYNNGHLLVAPRVCIAVRSASWRVLTCSSRSKRFKG